MSQVNYQASTVLSYSPKKSRNIINVLRGMNLSEAINTLYTMNKGQTKQVYKLLKSAATNLKLSEADYSKAVITTIVAEEAQKLYRVVPRARGSAFRIRRRYSRLKISLSVK